MAFIAGAAAATLFAFMAFMAGAAAATLFAFMAFIAGAAAATLFAFIAFMAVIATMIKDGSAKQSWRLHKCWERGCNCAREEAGSSTAQHKNTKAINLCVTSTSNMAPFRSMNLRASIAYIP